MNESAVITTSAPAGAPMYGPFIQVVFQQGSVDAVGVNGCRVEDVMEVLMAKLKEYEAGPLGCLENEEALHHLELGRTALLRRRKLREEQGVINTCKPHESLFENRTEDEEADFSATGS